MPVIRASLFAACAVLWLAPHNGAAAHPAPPLYSEAREELILEVVKQPYRLAEAIIVLQVGSRHYLPLNMLAGLMEIALESDVAQGSAKGWFPKESDIFILDYDKHEWRNRDGVHKLHPHELIVAAQEGEIYIDSKLLEQLWPDVRFTVSLSTLQLEITSDVPLHFEARLARETARDHALKSRERNIMPDLSGWPVVRNPYRLLSLPVLDVEAEGAYRSGATDPHSARLHIHGRHDIGFMSADYTGNFAHDRTRDITDPTSLRLRLERRSYGDDQMPLGLRHIQGGDIHLSLPDLLAGGAGGRGLSLSNNPIRHEGSFDRITVDGTGQPGWEIELYRNNELIAFTTIDATGLYRFENVEIHAGNNQMRIMQYGPQGQMKEDIRYYTIGAGMVRPGAFEYRMGFVERDRPLLSSWVDMDGQENITPRNFTAHAYLARGLSNGLTGFASLTRMDGPQDKAQSTLSLGLTGTLLNGHGWLEAYQQIGDRDDRTASGKQALDARFAALWRKISLNMRASLYGKNYESEKSGYGPHAKAMEIEASAATTLRRNFGMLGLQAGFNHMRDREGESSTIIDTRQSVSRGPLHLTHNSQTRLSGGRHDYSNAMLGLNSRLYHDFYVRGQMQYDLYPSFRAQNALAKLRYRSPQNFSAALRGQYMFDRGEKVFGGQIAYDFGSFLASLDMDWYEHDGLALLLRASTSLGPTGDGHKYTMRSTRLTSYAPLDARIFVDENADGAFNDGDLAVSDAGLRSPLFLYPERSDEEGRLRLFAGQEGRTPLLLDIGTLNDPYHQPAIKGVLADLRPGAPLSVDFPVVETGAIDGTITRANGQAAAHIPLILRDASGEIVQATKSAYDGYYNFDFIPRGTYQIATAPDYEFDSIARTVQLEGDHLFQFGFDLSLPENTVP